jgi:hypothetical protein
VPFRAGEGRLVASRVRMCELGAPDSRAAGPRFLRTPLQTVPQAAPEAHRSTSDSNQRCYGESPMGLRRQERAVGDVIPPTEAVKNRCWRSGWDTVWATITGREMKGRHGRQRRRRSGEGAWESGLLGLAGGVPAR